VVEVIRHESVPGSSFSRATHPVRVIERSAGAVVVEVVEVDGTIVVVAGGDGTMVTGAGVIDASGTAVVTVVVQAVSSRPTTGSPINEAMNLRRPNGEWRATATEGSS
jgi:hypothetical protein